jgi:hypothetical protein
MTDGLLVFVQLVIAAMTTAPWPISTASPFCTTAVRRSALSSRAKPRSLSGARSDASNACFIRDSGMRSCGRLGPAKLGSTVPMSSDSVRVNSGVGASSERNKPCSLV